MRALPICVVAMVGCTATPAAHRIEAPPLATSAEVDAAAQAPLPANDLPYVAEIAPFQVMDDLYYVGAVGVSSFLITTPEGDFLIGGGTPQTLIEAHLVSLGASIHQVRFLLNTHAHYDHAADWRN